MQKQVYQYISKQTNDPIVERKKCEISGQEFPIYKSDLEFYDKISPIFDGKKYQIPTPRLCPEERQRRRLMFRNERKLYKRKCDATGEVIISTYSPDKDTKVFNTDYRWSDNMSGEEFFLKYNTKKTIMQHLEDINRITPKISLLVKMNENCTYVNNVGNSKNCYLIFDSDFCEDSYHSSIIKHSKNIVDSLHIYFSENCYNSINCTDSYNLINCIECDNSQDLHNCTMCSGCYFCIGCTNLVNKKYCIENKQYTKEEYFKIVALGINKYKKLTILSRNLYKYKDEGGVGNNLYSTKNCRFSYNIGYSENLKYSDLVTSGNDCYDISSYGENLNWSYESCSIGFNVSNILFSLVVTSSCNNLMYCTLMIGSSNCFGCVGLKNKQYCIFNKQYTKKEYNKLVPQIIEKMIEEGTRGEFFDRSLSPFGYNETVAQEYFPLTREEALARGYKRQDNNYDPVVPEHIQTLKGDQIPSDISTVTDEILKKILICEVSGRPFRIIKQELEFYRKHNLPLPRKHPDVRHEERLKQRLARELHLRNCDKCKKEMLSVYNNYFEGKTYCQDCYQTEIYG